MPSEDDRQDAPVHQQNVSGKDLYAARGDISITNNYYPQGSQASPWPPGIPSGATQNAYNVGQAGAERGTAGRNSSAEPPRERGRLPGTTARHTRAPEPDGKISQALQTPLAILSLAAALLALKWTFLSVASILALAVAVTALVVRRRQGRPWSDSSVAATAAISVVAFLVLVGTFTRGAINHSPSVIPPASGSTPNTSAPSSPSASAKTTISQSPTAAPTSSPPLIITGHWTAQNGPLTLTVTKVELNDGVLQIGMKATNYSSSGLSLGLFDNCEATDNANSNTLTADSSASTWADSVPDNGGFIVGTVVFDGTLPANATTLNVSFVTIFGQGQDFSSSGITVSGVPIPR